MTEPCRNLCHEQAFKIHFMFCHAAPRNTQSDSEASWPTKLEKAKKLAGRGELSSAARLLRSNGLAPGNNDTLQQLCDPLLRPRHRLLDFPPEVLNYTSDEPVQLDRDLLLLTSVVHLGASVVV